MKKNEGITLVILVITIIILIILAVLGIALVVGDNGVLSQAKNSSENTIVSKEKEAISFALNALLADKTVFVIDEIDKDNLEQELNKLLKLLNSYFFIDKMN